MAPPAAPAAEGPRERALPVDGGRLEAAPHEEAREPFADEAGDHVAIEVVLGDRLGALPHVDLDVLRHPVAHLDGDVADDVARRLGQPVEDAAHAREALEQRALRALAHAAHAPPLVAEVRRAEGAQVGALDLVAPLEGLHVVLDRVERAQHDVEDEDVDRHLARQLADHRGEGARDLAELDVAKVEVGLRGGVGREVRLEGARDELDVQPRRDLERPHQLVELAVRVRRHLAVGALLVGRRRRVGPRPVGEVARRASRSRARWLRRSSRPTRASPPPPRCPPAPSPPRRCGSRRPCSAPPARRTGGWRQRARA